MATPSSPANALVAATVAASAINHRRGVLAKLPRGPFCYDDRFALRPPRRPPPARRNVPSGWLVPPVLSLISDQFLLVYFVYFFKFLIIFQTI
uniref:Uncharacterized protein n=1 Tax=Oryza barthii TaxID=65489 RepID=A0A0D3H9L3_9ORYZ